MVVTTELNSRVDPFMLTRLWQVLNPVRRARAGIARSNAPHWQARRVTRKTAVAELRPRRSARTREQRPLLITGGTGFKPRRLIARRAWRSNVRGYDGALVSSV